jgi:hypothetical protein
MLLRVGLVRSDVSKELIASIIRVTKIGELETTLRMVSSGLLRRVALVRTQKTPFFIVTAVKTSNLT